MKLILIIFPVIIIICIAILLYFWVKISSLKKELQISRKYFVMSYPKEYILRGILLFVVSIILSIVISIHGMSDTWTFGHTILIVITGILGFFSIIVFAVFSTYKIVVGKDIMYVYNVYRKNQTIVFSDIVRVEREYKCKKIFICNKKRCRSKLFLYHNDFDRSRFCVDESMIGIGVLTKMLEKNGIKIIDRRKESPDFR